MKTLIAIFTLATLISQASFARNWDRIEIPGAVCGDGLPYAVFVSKKPASKNLIVEFMGGGACWNFDTCYSFQFAAWMHPIIEVPFYSYLTSDVMFLSDHPFTNDSAIYMPYCTGDTFAGSHTANYSGFSANHHGYRNVLTTFQYLAKKNILNFPNTERLTVWGASAGAIGALVHMKNLEPYFPKAKKVGIIDSAGLHFGVNFWKKFTPQQVNDFTKAFANAGLILNTNDGFIAQHMAPVFTNLKNWTLGIMQSTRDGVMSAGFGDISPENHRKLVLSDKGIAAIAKPFANISVWYTDTDQHTFLLKPDTTMEKNMYTGQTAMDFVNQTMTKSAYKK
jgi:hypothetical protein